MDIKMNNLEQIKDKLNQSVIHGDFENPCKECGKKSSYKQHGIYGWEYRCDDCFSTFKERIIRFVQKYQ